MVEQNGLTIMLDYLHTSNTFFSQYHKRKLIILDYLHTLIFQNIMRESEILHT